MSKLVCKDFSVKYFGYDAALSSVTTTFSDGVNVIYAATKGGKTTFLKALAGIVPYQGELTLDGVSLTDVSLKDRDFQMLFDDYALFTRRSARYNLEYPLRLRKIPKAERNEMVERVAELFDLDVMLDAPVYRLNEWLKVTLVLCRAYLRRPKVLLIDNIFSKLDPTLRKEAFLRFMPLFKDGIVIYATDSAEEAAALSKSIKVLSCGYLMQEGSASDFAKKPNAVSVFTAFERYPSVFSCTVSENALTVDGCSFAVNFTLKSDVYLGKDVFAGCSPTDLAVSEAGFNALLCGKFYFNDKPLYVGENNGAKFFFFGDEGLEIGKTVHLSVKNVAGLFDALNERSILEVSE